jgi:hypothetical protein
MASKQGHPFPKQTLSTTLILLPPVSFVPQLCISSLFPTLISSTEVN